ncbi:MAG: hypothetical protein AAF755_10360 [Pseudomonadota bacterium]
MFAMNHTPTFTRTVEIKVPVDGGHDLQTLQVTYRIFKDEEMFDFDMNTAEGQKDYLRKVIDSMGDIVDEAGQQVPYNDSLREHILALPYTRVPLMQTYNTAMLPALLGN